MPGPRTVDLSKSLTTRYCNIIRPASTARRPPRASRVCLWLKKSVAALSAEAYEDHRLFKLSDRVHARHKQHGRTHVSTVAVLKDEGRPGSATDGVTRKTGTAETKCAAAGNMRTHTRPQSQSARAPHMNAQRMRRGHEPETRQDATHTGPHAGMGTHTYDSPSAVGRKTERRQRPAQRHRDPPASRRRDTCARTHDPRVSRRGMRAGRAAERPQAVPSLQVKHAAATAGWGWSRRGRGAFTQNAFQRQ